MRITTRDLDAHTPCAIDVPLQRLAASAEPLQAACWQKLLDLVVHLQSSPSDLELRGQILLETLLLHKPEPPDPLRDLQMKRFMDEWHARNPGPATRSDQLRREMRRRFPPKPKVLVSVRVDWHDYAPLRDGLPELHYRIEVQRPGKTITEEARAKDAVEAERIIGEAFGW